MNEHVMIDEAAGETIPPAVPVKPKGIAVLGSHPATVMQAPFNDDWLIYACSPHNFEQRRLPRWDEWFEIHIPLADKTRAYPYLKFLEGVPLVWMRDRQSMPFFKSAKQREARPRSTVRARSTVCSRSSG